MCFRSDMCRGCFFAFSLCYARVSLPHCAFMLQQFVTFVTCRVLARALLLITAAAGARQLVHAVPVFSRGPAPRMASATSDTTASSGFSFQAEIVRQSNDSPKSTTPSKRGRNGTPKHSTSAGRTCRLCEEECATSSPYCWQHKRGYNNISKQALKAKAKPAPGNQLWKDFCEIFGEGRAGPPNKALADQVLMDYVAQFPEGKSGARRGTVTLGSYIHNAGSRASEEVVSTRPKWDYEIFEGKMKMLRSWTSQQCRDHWRELEANPEIARDAGGPKGAMRLSIPSNLTGGDADEFRAGNFEERSIAMSSKARQMSDEDRSKFLAETRSGFDLGALASPNAKQQMATALPASAAAASDVEVLKGLFGAVKPELPVPTGAAAAPDSAAASPRPAGDPPVTPIKPKVVDICRGRAKLWAAIRDDMEKYKAKMHAELKASKVAMANSNEDEHGKLFITPVVERHTIAAAFLGVDLNVSKKDGEETQLEHVAIAAKDIERALDEHGRCSAHDKLVQDALGSASVLPMESKELMSWSSLDAFHETVQQVDEHKALEQKQSQCDLTVSLMNQLLAGLRQSTREPLPCRI